MLLESFKAISSASGFEAFGSAVKKTCAQFENSSPVVWCWDLLKSIFALPCQWCIGITPTTSLLAGLGGVWPANFFQMDLLALWKKWPCAKSVQNGNISFFFKV